MKTALKFVLSLVLILAAGAFAAARLRGPQGVPALTEKYRAVRQMEDENDEIRRDNERRRLRNQDLAKPDVMELEIRKRLNRLRKGETEFKLPPEPPAQP